MFFASPTNRIIRAYFKNWLKSIKPPPHPTKLVGNKAAFEPEITLLQYFDNIEKCVWGVLSPVMSLGVKNTAHSKR